MNGLAEINLAVEFLRERGCTRSGGEWRYEGSALGSDPITAMRALRRHLISRGPANARSSEGRAVWTR